MLRAERGSKLTCSVHLLDVFPFQSNLSQKFFESSQRFLAKAALSLLKQKKHQRRYFVMRREGISVVTRPVPQLDTLVRFASNVSQSSFESPSLAQNTTKPKQSLGFVWVLVSAEREGFEPSRPFSLTVFKTVRFNHSRISPYVYKGISRFSSHCVMCG